MTIDSTGPMPNGFVMSFDFRMTDNAANSQAGGCCGSAADGLGIGLFGTDTYGFSGANNPDAGGENWERPSMVDALTVGLDIFSNIDVVSINLDNVELATANVQPFLDLNNNLFHRAIVEVMPDGTDAILNMTIIEDVHGAAISHSIFTDLAIPTLDLADLGDYRLIAGGRTGGAVTAGDLDNINISAKTTVPEPATAALGLMGLAGLAARQRRHA